MEGLRQKDVGREIKEKQGRKINPETKEVKEGKVRVEREQTRVKHK